jgi:hypothetical protein
MSEPKQDLESGIVVFICGTLCSAGGSEEDEGHVFDVEWESEDGLCGGYKCRACGLPNMYFDMSRGP